MGELEPCDFQTDSSELADDNHAEMAETYLELLKIHLLQEVLLHAGETYSHVLSSEKTNTYYLLLRTCAVHSLYTSKLARKKGIGFLELSSKPSSDYPFPA